MSPPGAAPAANSGENALQELRRALGAFCDTFAAIDDLPDAARELVPLLQKVDQLLASRSFSQGPAGATVSNVDEPAHEVDRMHIVPLASRRQQLAQRLPKASRVLNSKASQPNLLFKDEHLRDSSPRALRSDPPGQTELSERPGRNRLALMPRPKAEATLPASPGPSSTDSVMSLAVDSAPAAIWTPGRGVARPVTLALALALGILGIAIGVDRLRSELSMQSLADALADGDRAKITTALASRYESPLDRENARRDYLVARCLDAADADGANVLAVGRNIDRAIARAPAHRWFRWSAVAFQNRHQPRADNEEARATAARLSANDAFGTWLAAQGALAAGRRVEAIRSFTSAHQLSPILVPRSLKALIAARIPISEALDSVPPNSIGVMGAVETLRGQGLPWRAYLESQLSHITTSAAEPDEWAMVAMAYATLDRPREAVAWMERALASRGDRTDWMLMLSEWYYRNQQYAEADRLTASILRQHGGDLAAENARKLREKIDLARRGTRATAAAAN